MQELLHARGAQLVLDLPAHPRDHLPTLRADPDRRLQGVLNLLSKAVTH